MLYIYIYNIYVIYIPSIYQYLHIELLDSYFTFYKILLDKISLVIFLKLRKI